ncbi:MAG: 3'-5' exoribonuclease YhaM family protein [Planctomycetota bacterium]|jgi:3'-5' exoribonuclease
MPPNTHLYIKDIQPGQQIQDTYMVTQPVLRNTAKGDLYIAMFLSDKTGKVNSRMWQATQELYQAIPSEGFLAIRGKSELYQGNMQLVVNDIQVVEPDQVRLMDYMPRTEHNIGEMFEQVLKLLTQAFLNDSDIMKQFCIAPAAMQMHHNYLGGLLEHTLSMLNVAQVLFPLYPKIQKDLVLAAILLHDMGKTQELSYEIGFSYTDRGQLLGHIVQITQIITQKCDELSATGTPVKPEILDNLLHIILSHHGQYDFGSPKLPATPEAFMVNYIDNLDAKMNQTAALIENDPGNDNWTAYQRSLETKLYRNRVLENGQ